MNILAIATKGCGQLTSNGTYLSGRCFSSVKKVEEAMAAGVEYCRTAKKIHNGFCLATLEKLIKNCLGGSYLVMKITPRFTGEIPLLSIWYK